RCIPRRTRAGGSKGSVDTATRFGHRRSRQSACERRWGRKHCSAAFPDGDRRAGRRPLERLQSVAWRFPDSGWKPPAGIRRNARPESRQRFSNDEQSLSKYWPAGGFVDPTVARCFITFEQIETHRRRYTMTHAFRIATAAVCVLLGAGTHPAFASSQTQTYELELFVPQISQAANGELVSITGGGLFSIHHKTV